MKNLKLKLTIWLLAASAVSTPLTISAQLTKEQVKERQDLKKRSKKELSEKASKDARKEAKRLKKEGWTVAPGALPLEKQLDRSYTMQYEYGADLFPSYILAEGMSIGSNYDSAKMQALELAKQNLASQIQSEVAALIENSVANEQLGKEEAASIAKSISVGKSLIIQSLGRVIPVVESYRTLQNKNKEVLVKIAYNEEMARQAALKAAKAGLADESEELHQELDEILSRKRTNFN